MDRLAEDALKYDKRASGIYVTLNKLNPQLAARGELNKAKNTKGEVASTSDTDVIRRMNLGIDFDPLRPGETSSSNEQHEQAIAKAKRVADWLHENGFPEPIVADSGNGCHLVYAMDLQNSPEIKKKLIDQFMRALDYVYESTEDKIAVDLKVTNAGRIWKLYGNDERQRSR